MGRQARDVTDAELAVLQVLWDRGPATIREMREVLYPEGGTSEYATVQKLLDRLGTKGYVGKERRKGAQVYQARLERDALIGQRVEALMQGLCGGSLEPLFSHLVANKRLSARNVQELRDLVEELDQGAPDDGEGSA